MEHSFTPRPTDIDELVINWHLTKKCNYRCDYCFATWDHEQAKGEVWRSKERTERFLRDLWIFFRPDNHANALREKIRWNSVRLSIAGGEAALLGDRLIDIVQQAQKMGFSVSLISNGSRLSAAYLTELAPHLSVLGLSVDSIEPGTNVTIGRLQKGKSPLSLNDIDCIVKSARSAKSGLSIKINTVVNHANGGETLSELLNCVEPDRWKVLRMLPILSNKLSTGADEFDAFVARHSAYASVMSVENNIDMTQSYIMLNPQGQFFQNSMGYGSYLYSDPIEQVGAMKAFFQVPFVPSKFAARYNAPDMQKA